MLKTICKNVVWMAVPLSLALGCAANRQPTEAAVYSPAPGEVLTPTSGEPEQRIYSSTQPGPADTSTSMAAPTGASAANWNVAEAIREKLTEDASIAPQGSSLIAEVGADGVVTLKGRLSSPSEKERVHKSLANLPGVTGINDDQVGIGRAAGNGILDMNK